VLAELLVLCLQLIQDQTVLIQYFQQSHQQAVVVEVLAQQAVMEEMVALVVVQAQ
tara:strand:+ start:91 stop:255 length:165 start_codon:yes stop_codon:yes gene_type:complete